MPDKENTGAEIERVNQESPEASLAQTGEKSPEEQEREVENFLNEAARFVEFAVGMNQATQKLMQDMVVLGMPLDAEMEATMAEMQKTTEGLMGERGEQEKTRLREYVNNLPPSDRSARLETIRVGMQKAQEVMQQRMDSVKADFLAQQINPDQQD